MAEQTELDRELYSLLKKEGVDPRTYAGVAAGLQAELETPIPMRSAFKAELRTRLMAEAAGLGRRPTSRWFQRPALWSAVGGAAAVFVLAIGLRLYGQGPAPSPAIPGPSPLVPEVTAPEPIIDDYPVPGTAHMVGRTTLPLVQVPDEHEVGTPTGGAALESVKELPVFRLTGTVDSSLVKGLAQRLAFQSSAPVDAGEFYRVAEGDREMQVSRAGVFRYEDRTVVTAAAEPVTESEAVQAANEFLRTAALPVVDAAPKVAPEAEAYLISYQDRHEGRPIIGGSTRVWVSQGGSVRRVESFTPAGEEQDRTYNAVSYSEAIAEAEAKGGQFDRGDLVWVRTPVGSMVFLQPYWRLFGQDDSGPIVRYVPALERR